MNPFVHSSAAERYAASRPYFHPVVMERLRARYADEVPFGEVLDVGCGTGQSSIALKALAVRIIGVDSSPEMLAQAPHGPAIAYECVNAEALPFPDGSFDLVTVSCAFHWFDRHAFMAEAHRVLRPRGRMVVYNNAFRGVMTENPAFRPWFWDEYIARYPAPPRHREPLDAAFANLHGLTFLGEEIYSNTVTFDPESLTKYLATQSNIIAAVENGREPLASTCAWVLNSVRPLFGAPTGTFEFRGPIWHLQRET